MRALAPWSKGNRGPLVQGSWMKLLNRYKKYRDKSVTTDNNKYNY